MASGEGLRTDGYTAVPKDVRGSVDTPVASQYGSGTLRVERLFGNRGRVFLSGSLYGEDRLNGTPLQINDTTIRQLALGTDYDSSAAGLFTLRLYGGTENYHQTFSSIAADRNSESLTNIQYVPSQQMGLLAQWSKQIASRLTLLAGLDGLYVQGFSNETTLFARPTNGAFVERRHAAIARRIRRRYCADHAALVVDAGGQGRLVEQLRCQLDAHSNSGQTNAHCLP